jgi:hypothetical protein
MLCLEGQRVRFLLNVMKLLCRNLYIFFEICAFLGYYTASGGVFFCEGWGGGGFK